MRFIFLFLLAITIFKSTTHAQSRPCGTDMMVRKSLSQHPELQVQRDELESFTRQFTSSNDRALKVIPVVFHVIHNYGSENIDKTQIEDEIRILNEDYQLLNPDQNEVIPAFASIVANVGFEFRLAQLDPNGNCTDGITRTVSTLTYSADDNVKDLVVWPRNKYLNVWVVDNISFGAGGYAYLPGSSQAATDGIVVLHTQLGSIGTSGGSNFSARTLTHEVGHWFNLLHTWGDTNSPGDAANCSTDDNVTDTPNTIGVANQNCNLAQSTCGMPVDNVQNYMDYSSCAKMFTNGQKARMIAAINSGTSSRNNLWTDANLQATGVNDAAVPCSPIADFKASGLAACTNANITFQDQSYNASIDATWTWNWSFPGGTPSSSNLQNPVVTYSTPGIYSATLNVSNSAGSNVKTKSNYISISTSTPNLISPIAEGFEIAAFPQNSSDATMNWRYEGTVSNGFARTTTAFASGTASLKYNNLSIASDNSSSVVSPVIDFSAVTAPATMNFKVAYARRSSTTNDKLEMWISIDCGKTWSRRYSKVGATLATTTSLVSSTFVPTSSQWRTETVSVAPLVGESHGMIKFTVIDSSGNNLYIDDINLVNSPGVGISTPSLDEYVTQIFPNPGMGNAKLTFGLFKSEDVTVELLDVTGRVIGNKYLGTKQAGEYTLGLNEISGSSFSSGIYLIRIQAGNSSAFRKWICN